MKSPTYYQGGFWADFTQADKTYRVASTEPHGLAIEEKSSKNRRLLVSMRYAPNEEAEPLMRFRLELWTHDEPVLLLRHISQNISGHSVTNLHVTNIMDFDLGGPTSYNNDSGTYDPEKGVMYIHDDEPLFVALSARPSVQAWEMSSPLKLGLSEGLGELTRNLSEGPRDIATALQWNHGDLSPGESKVVDMVFSAGNSLTEVDELAGKAWRLYAKRMQ